MGDYHEISYWCDRYIVDTEPFEWYTEFATLRPIIASIINTYMLSLDQAPESHVHKAKSTQMRTRTLSQVHPQHDHDADNTSLNPPRQLRPRGSSMIHIDQRSKHRGSPRMNSNIDSMKRQLQILEIGCGTSQLAIEIAQMCSDRAQVVAIDFAEPVIEENKSKYAYSSPKAVIWQVMDVREMDFPDNYFDIIIEKGCLDCLYCGGKVTTLINDEDSAEKSHIVQAVCEIERVLKPQGTLLSISHASPDNRTQQFRLDALYYEKMGLELAQKAKEQRRASIGTNAGRRSILVSGLTSSPAMLQRRSLIRPRVQEDRYCFDQPIVHQIDRNVAQVDDVDEEERLQTGNFGGWLDSKYFVYEMKKSRLLHGSSQSLRRSLLTPGHSTLQSPAVHSRKLSMTNHGSMRPESRRL